MKTGQPLVLYMDTAQRGPSDKSIVDWWRKQLAKLSIQFEPRQTDWNRFQEKLRKGNTLVPQDLSPQLLLLGRPRQHQRLTSTLTGTRPSNQRTIASIQASCVRKVGELWSEPSTTSTRARSSACRRMAPSRPRAAAWKSS